jgi:hypothetical protein
MGVVSIQYDCWEYYNLNNKPYNITFFKKNFLLNYSFPHIVLANTMLLIVYIDTLVVLSPTRFKTLDQEEVMNSI